MFENASDVVETTGFHLYLEILAILAAIIACAVYGLLDAAGKVNVIVLYQNHIVETHTVVGAAAGGHSLLFQYAHTRRCFARVEHTRLRALQLLLIACRKGGYAAHTLHNVEHGTFGGEQRTLRSARYERNVALFHRRAVGDEHLSLYCRVKTLQHRYAAFHAGKHTIFLYQKTCLAHGVGRYRRQRSVVAVADVLGKGQIQQCLKKLFCSFHKNFVILHKVNN